MKEIFKDIEGYEGRYKVSNYGRVFSSNYNKTGAQKEMSLTKCNGYFAVTLSLNGKHKLKKVHRLVAEAFLPNPNEHPVINHKDENTFNNHVFINIDGSVDPDKSNLEWCSLSHNYHWGTSPQKVKNKLTNRGDLSLPVLMFDMNGQYICEYPSLMEIKRQRGFEPSLVSKCCNGVFKQCYGYKWKYK